MSLKLFYAILLTILPLSELRVGLPLAVSYAIEKNIPIVLIFVLILAINILLIFFVFYFLEVLHGKFMKWKFYEKLFEKYVSKFQRKVERFEQRREKWGFVALFLFVAVPLPGTGAWSGCLVSWILGLDKKKSVLAISLGIVVAALIILFVTLGFFHFFGLSMA